MTRVIIEWKIWTNLIRVSFISSIQCSIRKQINLGVRNRINWKTIKTSEHIWMIWMSNWGIKGIWTLGIIWVWFMIRMKTVLFNLNIINHHWMIVYIRRIIRTNRLQIPLSSSLFKISVESINRIWVESPIRIWMWLNRWMMKKRIIYWISISHCMIR